MKYTPERITNLGENEVFVFGSNLAGAHGGGAALVAMRSFGAIWGQGVGLQGQSYGIPTMHGGVDVIKPYVDEFIEFAKQHTELFFAPLFKNAMNLKNVALPKSFVDEITK